MLSQKEVYDAFEKACREAGRDTETYAIKMKSLIAQWQSETHSEAKNLMTPFISSVPGPFHVALAIDNVNFFKTYYNKNDSQLNANALLATACLCGSEAVAEFLLNSLELNYLSENHEYILNYVALSGNQKWASKIAHMLADAGKPMPTQVALADDATVDTLTAIFSRAEKKVDTPVVR